MTKKEKYLIGKRIFLGEVDVKDVCIEHNVSRQTAWRWAKAYEQSPVAEGEPKPKITPAPSKPLGVPAAKTDPQYEAMGKPELIKELMKRDIEVARLKKGYSVKGGGSKKEYVIFSGSSTK